jgi:hypothetical protein
LPADTAQETARMLSEGRWTHDFPIEVEHARTLALPVSTELPDEVRLLMRLYRSRGGGGLPWSTSPRRTNHRNGQGPGDGVSRAAGRRSSSGHQEVRRFALSGGRAAGGGPRPGATAHSTTSP